MIGQTIAHYRIVRKIGQGGMGEVYLAEDQKLDRKVAVKFLSETMGRDSSARARFLREAKSAAALDHPYICKIYDVGEFQARDFIIMEYVEGQTLASLLRGQPLPLDQALEITSEIVDALAKAHQKGIIHRDMKPSNLMITAEGHVKVLDFGLAKPITSLAESAAEAPTVLELTREGSTVGTIPYMSPEQIRGEAVDARSDLFSLGVILYEMLTGAHPFEKPSVFETANSILSHDPPPLMDSDRQIPEKLQPIVFKMLAKSADERYASAAELGKELDDSRSEWFGPEQATSFGKRRNILIVAALLILVIAGGGTWFWIKNSRIKWVYNEALPQAESLLAKANAYAAFQILKQAREHLPDDPRVRALFENSSVVNSIRTNPAGADIYYKPYADPDSEWMYAGKSPLEKIPVPAYFLRWKATKEGFEPVERARYSGLMQVLELDLVPTGEAPAGMVQVPARNYSGRGLSDVKMQEFWIDTYEVTNKQFKEFVDAGGYRKREFWKHAFVKEGGPLSWEEAMAEFRDLTGQPGPATWKLGAYPEGSDQLPVSGVSWYEAAAYCEFAGKNLPTVHHWLTAVGLGSYTPLYLFSNFSSEGPVPVGSRASMVPYGAYDMAGNVQEWCWNDGKDGQRYTVGGAWNDPPYMYGNLVSRPAFSRPKVCGFRCVQYPVKPAAELLAAVNDLVDRDFRNRKPADDREFEIYQRFYTYERTDLNPKLELTEEHSSYWRKETITFDAAYGKERLIAYIFLPKNARPPYQTVVYFPGSTARQPASSRNLAELNIVSFIPRSGRALVYPVYKGMYERHDNIGPATGIKARDLFVLWAKDLRRSVDYLETRKDVDHRHLAYFGLSLGGAVGPVMTVVEDRFQASVLLAGGFVYENPPEADPVNFAPRVRIPTLMINGRYDSVFKFETSQLPLLQLLGASEKRHATFQSEHIPLQDDIARETLAWLDRHLGPVAR